MAVIMALIRSVLPYMFLDLVYRTIHGTRLQLLNFWTGSEFPFRTTQLIAYILILSFKFDLTLTLPGQSAGVSGSLDSYCSLKPLCSGMGEVVPARTSQALPPPSPRTVL